MDRLRAALAILGVISALAAIASVWLFLSNPTVRSTSLGQYTCSAPYDTVLFDADNVPGGEPPVDADEVEARCVAAGRARFVAGAFVGAAAIAVAASTTILAARRRTKADEDLAGRSVPASI